MTERLVPSSVTSDDRAAPAEGHFAGNLSVIGRDRAPTRPRGEGIATAEAESDETDTRKIDSGFCTKPRTGILALLNSHAVARLHRAEDVSQTNEKAPAK